MIESKEYKDHKNDIKDKSYHDFMYSDGFTDGYENSYETHKPYLEWQKPEDVELDESKLYAIKDTTGWVVIGKYKGSNLFYDGKYYYRIGEILIKQIEV